MLSLPSPSYLSVRADEPNADTETLAAVRGSVEHHRLGALSKLFEYRLRLFASGGWGVEVSAFGVSVAVKNAERFSVHHGHTTSSGDWLL